LPRNIERAAAQATAAGLDASVKVQLGRAEALPLPDSSVDLVWCKEALMFAELQAALPEFRRVLRPNGMGFVYQVLTGPHMSDAEAREFWSVDLGWAPAHSQRPADIKAAIASVGLELHQQIDFGSE
jgi:ubiquinone/menaquinone biosynthesis C-methylase UbiE